MLEVAVLFSFLTIGITAMLIDIARWPCGRCHQRQWPWRRSCQACVAKLAERFR